MQADRTKAARRSIKSSSAQAYVDRRHGFDVTSPTPHGAAEYRRRRRAGDGPRDGGELAAQPISSSIRIRFANQTTSAHGTSLPINPSPLHPHHPLAYDRPGPVRNIP
ncbi:hypothetical protein CSOJ01_09216 [Colletotrichum sojae]|uniref:Uncharacterized protein n=1 Tax=Colletotrichum sojae TaxID=2175907 RepID=A0A8H6J4H3_9PEZI|nr:hypothetical protein CSOJ01_09216 [Colletotrichum sojae]